MSLVRKWEYQSGYNLNFTVMINIVFIYFINHGKHEPVKGTA